MKKWKPAPEAAADAFARATAGLAGAEPRKMFGYACAFAGGNMFVGLHEAGMVLRLPDADRDEVVSAFDAKPFEPMPGRLMREYVVVPSALLGNDAELRRWVERSLGYARSLPAKGKKSASAKTGPRRAVARARRR